MTTFTLQDGSEVTVELVVRQAALLSALTQINQRSVVQQHIREFIWRLMDRWESHGNLTCDDERSGIELRDRYAEFAVRLKPSLEQVLETTIEAVEALARNKKS